MALYTERTYEDLLRDQLAQQQAEQAKAMQAYNAQKNRVDQKYSGGLGGFLGDIVGGVGKFFGDIGQGVGGLIGTGVASAKDLIESAAEGKVTDRNTRDFKKDWYKAENDKDAAAKAAGTSLNAAANVASFIPGVGAGTAAGKVAGGVAANTAMGALGGFGDEFQQQGQDAQIDSAVNRALAGGAAGLATGGLNRKLGNATSKVGSALLNNKVATSTLGRGALSGAVGGAVGAGTSAALGGGDVAQAALQGGLTGAAGGATQAGLMAGANKLGQAAKNNLDNMYSNAVNKNAVNRLAQGIEQRTDGNIKFARVSKETLADINSIRQASGLDPLTQRQVTAYKNAVNNNLNNRYLENPSVMTPNKVAQMAFDSLTSISSEALPGNGGNTINVAPYNEKKYNGAVIGLAEDGGTSLKSIEPRSANKVNTLRQQKNDLLGQPGSPLVVDQEGGVTQTGTSLGKATPLGTRNSSVSQNTKNVNTDLMYGESNLANRTRKGQTAEALSRLGNTLEGAQTNVTRAAARDLGIDSAGKVVENVRKKTGLTNLETQAALAKELTGGENSLLDSIQRQALTASEDGRPFTVDTTSVENDIAKIVNKYADNNILDTKKTIQTLRRTVANNESDVISISNKLKDTAATLRGKGITEPPVKDKALAKIYTEVANNLDKLSYDAIPKSNVEDMFDVAVSELRGRAKQASNTGNKDIAKAYDTIADKLDAEPRTINAYRSFKKDFVDIAKINRLSGQAENGAAFQMGSSFAGGLKRGVNTLLQRPINAGLAMAGGAINSVADRIGTETTPVNTTQTQPLSQNTQTMLGNIIGRTTGQQQASNAVQNARKAQEYQNLEDMLSNIQSTPQVISGAQMGNMSGNTLGLSSMAQTSQANQFGAQLADIANGMQLALTAGDIDSYQKLADLYSTVYKLSGLGATENTTSNMTTSEKNQLAKLQSANTALDQLEQLYQKAGGGQGIIGGNIANFLGGLGLNSDVSTYNQLAQGLINQIGAAIGKTDSLNTEGEVQRALSLVPKITDDNQTAMNKLATLRALLQENTGTYNQLYGA